MTNRLSCRVCIISGVIYLGLRQDYLDNKLVVKLTDFARAVLVLEY